jgi:hypothetical protein
MTEHGSNSFSLEILGLCDGLKSTLLACEQHFIDILKPQYNVCTIAGSRIGLRATEQTKDKHRRHISENMVLRTVFLDYAMDRKLGHTPPFAWVSLKAN